MFQFRRFPSYTYLIQCRICGLFPHGFPHSEIHGSMLICSSPWLIAACRVLHRLPVPRHSPCALFCLTSLGSLKNYCGNLLLGLLYLHTLCQNRKTFKLIFVHLNVFSIVAFFFPLFSFQCAFFFFGVGLRPPPDYPLAYGSEVIFTGMNPPKMESVRFLRLSRWWR